MKRREFVAATAGALSIRPLGLHAQQNRPVIGFLRTNTPELTAGRLRAFREGLAETGYSEGRNVEIEYRWANERSIQRCQPWPPSCGASA